MSAADILAEIKQKMSDEADIDLREAYKALSSVVKTDVSSASEVLETVKTGLQSQKNDGYSLSEAYKALSSVVKADVSLAPRVFDTFETALKSEKNTSSLFGFGSLITAYESLSSLVEADALLALEVLSAVNTGLRSNKNNRYCLGEAYKALSSVVKADASLAPEVLETLKIGLPKRDMLFNISDENDSGSLEIAYKVLSDIVKENPSAVPEACDIFSCFLMSKKNNQDSWESACEVLSDIVKKSPSAAPEVFEVFETALREGKYHEYDLGYACGVLSSVVKENPSLVPEVRETMKNILLPDDYNETYHLADTYHALSDIAQEDPLLMPVIFDIYKTALQSEKSNEYTLGNTYGILSGIAPKNPSLASEVLETCRVAVQSEKNDWTTLKSAYRILSEIAGTDISLAPEIFEAFRAAVQSEKNGWASLQEAYGVLFFIAQANAPLTPEVLDIYKTALQSERNSGTTLKLAYNALSTIVQTDASLAPEILDVFRIGLQSEKNNEESLEEAYGVLSSIAKSDASLAPQVAQALLQRGRAGSSEDAFQLLSRCLKYCRPEDIGSVTEEQKQIVQAAWNMRFSTEQERRFAFDHMEIERIAATSFSAQQRCMNVLVGCLGQEKNLPAEATAGYRKDSDNELYKENADWLIPASFKAAELFGCYFPAYLKKTQGFFSVHDAVYWLPQGMSKAKNESFARFLQNNVVYADIDGNKKARPLSELNIIAKSWKALDPELEKAKYKDILAFCQSRKYADQEIEAFAVEAARWGVQEGDYKNCEKIYQAGLKVPEPFDSSKEFKFGKYTGRFLPRDDVRVGFFGEYTDCCQHFGGASNSCVVSSVMDPYSQLFVIENEKGSIIGGSWVWENTEGRYREVCFDNIEAIGEYASNPVVNKIYEQAGRYLAQEADCRRVTIGLGYQDADVSSYQKTEAIALPKQYQNKYSDARNQVLLAENPKAAPLDKSAESLRYVRDVCFLDVAAMEDISERCFPEGDKGLQIPDEPSGLVLVDKDKGVVGYCLYDKEEKSVYDMAVLPEYRKDKNASSGKLFAETVREIKKLGGEWTAELRDKTTMRYMEAMGQRGLVEYQVKGVDHEMSNGDKVYSVTFKPKVIAKQAQKVQTPLSNAAER